MYSILVVLGGGVLLTAGDVVLKNWLVTKSSWQYAGGFALYVLGLVCLIESFKHQNIAVASAVLVISNLAMLSIVSWLYFKEPLSPTSIVGMVLAVGAICCFQQR